MNLHLKRIGLFALLSVTLCGTAVGTFLFLSQRSDAADVPVVETVETPKLEHEPPKVAKAEPTLADDYEPGDGNYYILVNRAQNVVMVYGSKRDADAEQPPIKTFVASVGKEGSETIVGTFYVGDRYQSLFLVGDVWGRYAVRISGPYFFHSVPYFSKGEPWNDLEYLEYNKLGEGASAGCVRLAVRDAKWIYDNIPAGTTVEIYDSADLPAGVAKPVPIKISESDPNRGIDPTDSDF